MSLIPIRSISGQLPVVFVEARMQGDPYTVLTQLGLSLDTEQCNVALFTRTSGVLLVVGVGSYMMYRMFVRLLGRNFIWTLVDHSRMDVLARGDVRLLHPANIVTSSDMEDVYSSFFADDEYSDSCSETGTTHTKHTFLSPECSPAKRRLLLRRSARDRALPCVSTPIRKSPNGSSEDICDDMSSIHSARNSPNDRHRMHRLSVMSLRSEEDASRGLSQISVTCSDKSASLRLLWDDPKWDSELDLAPQDVVRRVRSVSPSNISEMSEFLAARNIFGDTASSKIDEEDDDLFCAVFQPKVVEEIDTTSESMQKAHDLIERSCMADSKHLYQIVPGYMTSSDAVSVCSERSTQSFLALRQRLAASAKSAGLLELSRPRGYQNVSGLDLLGGSMTDSAISKDTATTSSAVRNANRSALFDSAIGTDFISSEDEACGGTESSSIFPRTSDLSPADVHPNIIRRTGLNLISEDQMSVAFSDRSMEWFDDEFCGAAGSSNDCDDAELQEVVVDLNKLRLKVYENTRECVESSSSHVVRDRSQPDSSKYASEASSECRRVPSQRLRLQGTRDLVVWAREQFSADSAQLKMLHSLYSSRRRLKRVGMQRSDNSSEHLLASVLHSAVYHNLAILPCSHFSIVQEAITGAFARYDFLKQWPSFNQKHAANPDPDPEAMFYDTVASNDQRAVDLMQTLWNLQHSKEVWREGCVNARCVDALRLLLVLRAVDVFESLDEQHSLPRSFYSRLFADFNPRQIMLRINEGIFQESELCLLADTLRIRLEVIDCTRSSTDESPIVRTYPDTDNSFPVLPFVKLDAHRLYPLYYVAD